MRVSMFGAAVLSVVLMNVKVAGQAARVDAMGEGEEETLSIHEEGYLFHGLLLQPEVSLSLSYDSNIFATRNGEVEDSVLLLSPVLQGKSTWDRHQLRFDAGGALGRYSDNHDENFGDYWGNVSGRYDLSEKTNLFGGLGYSFEHEDRGSPEEDLSGTEPTTFDSSRAHLGLTHAFGAWVVRAGGTFERLDFDNVGALYNDDRDRDLTGFGMRLSRTLSPRYTLYGQVVRDIRDYDLRVDDAGFQRDSAGYRAGLGVQARFSNRLRGEAYLGYIEQHYDDAGFGDTDAMDYSASLNWRAAPRTTMSAALDRSLDETTLPGASGYLYNSLSGRVEHWVAPRLNLSASASLAEADYQSRERFDTYRTATLGMRYFLTPRIYLGAQYQVMSRDSSERELYNNSANPQDTDDYARNQVFLTLGTLLYPVKQPAYWNLTSGELLVLETAGWPGLYAGLQAGHETLSVQSNGVRGGSGTDDGQYSNPEHYAGLFLGYGLRWRSLYLGLEGEWEDGGSRIYHTKVKTDSRITEINREQGYGLGLRFGYELPTGNLVYARLGWVRTDLDAYYSLRSEPQNAYSARDTLEGIRYGVGADIAAGEHLFVRMDYIHTEYDDFIADVITEAEGFDPRADVFRLGLGWRFGGIPRVTSHPQVVHKGLYAGLHAGHGGLGSALDGVHVDGPGVPVTSEFTGDFGDDGGATGGIFLGYGLNRGSWYAGFEAELEDSTAHWSHVRDPNGRNFSVAKQDTWGLALRGGYILDNGTLLYLRGGHVRTGFNTTWSKGGNRLNDIDRDDTPAGERLGMGAELPVTRSSFLRLDYSYTRYDEYSFVTDHGNPDSMTFDNSETLFRIGYGMHF